MTEHAPADLISRYATGATLPADRLWALEAHLETCGTCRLRLADAAPPPVTALTESVWATLDPVTRDPAAVPRAPGAWEEADGEKAARGAASGEQVAGGVAWRRRVVVRRRFSRWAVPSLVPWLAMAVFVVSGALLLDLIAPGDSAPSLLLLVAPVVPVLGVAGAWSRYLDPAHDLVASTARAGLEMVLRRTFAVLLAVLPALFAGGRVTGASPAYWLLPSLAVTAVALALGSVIGVRLAARVTVGLWVVLVIGPAVVLGGVPVVLGVWVVWAAALVGGVAVVALRSARFAQL
ncbi:zf-HC2 domain-containing protein [Actinokineospora spheciospongiae]|uniref:zf-HC2 domain-containing protein n=1 Tax=Actinokineospora spheciospongiae TaxID=909613 RepID=UPI000D70AF20|nr:zf-HC2 domain-containing protein [Actinokineospora spheciospongiae]PWW66735.1 putative zinc finger protein [Actinokineospora spheciospongiae]